MPNFLKKYRSHRSEKPSWNGIFRSENTSKKGIFRVKKDEKRAIQPSITWTMSDDATIEQPSSPHTYVQDKKVVISSDDAIEATLTFTEKELMEHEINHIRQLAEKDREIFMYKEANQHIQAKFNKALAELKETCENDMDEKENEVAQLQIELQSSKEALKKISSVLIQTQHQLHEKTGSSSWLQTWLN